LSNELTISPSFVACSVETKLVIDYFESTVHKRLRYFSRMVI